MSVVGPIAAKKLQGRECKTAATGIAGCCATATRGHAAAALPKNATNSRRLRSSMRLPPQARHRAKNCASLRSNSNGFDDARPFFDLALDEFLEILGGPAVGGDKRIA